MIYAHTLNPDWQGVCSPTGSDTRFGLFFDTPSFVFGPVGRLLHCSNEYVELDLVVKTIKVLAAYIVDWCDIE
jgi:acetylornithine deacetylase/succinyl-diaminopimelate desuccinylase-like protein